MFLDQRVVERHRLEILECHLDLGGIVEDDRLADFDIGSLPVLAGNHRVEIDGAAVAGFGGVGIVLEAGVQLVGEERRIERGGALGGLAGVVAVERFEQRFRGFVGLGGGGQG